MRKYLIYQFACFGDCLYATTVARQLKHDEPDSHVTWAVSKRYRSILDGNPHVDAILELDFDPKNAAAGDFRRLEERVSELVASGEYDEVFHLQIFNRHLKRFHTTLRKTVFKVFARPITVRIDPVVVLSARERANVQQFALRHNLASYRHVVLFECSPSSGQSSINTQLACRIARQVIGSRNDICFILTTKDEVNEGDRQIISASSVSFRENLALLDHCTTFIGCSSGVTWLATAESARKVPMLQLLDENGDIFAGVSFDLKIHGVDTGHIIETARWTEADVVECVNLLLRGETEVARRRFHRMLVPSQATLRCNLLKLSRLRCSYGELSEYARDFIRENQACGNPIGVGRLGVARLILQSKLSLVQYSARARLKAWLFRSGRSAAA